MYTIFVIEGRNTNLNNEITKLLTKAYQKKEIKDWSERIHEPVTNVEDYLTGIFQGLNIVHSSRSKV